MTHAEEEALERVFKEPNSNNNINVVRDIFSLPNTGSVQVNDNTCSDNEIEQIISESIVDPEDRKPVWAICNLTKTESELQSELTNSGYNLKYITLFIICSIPILLINMMLNYRS